MSVLRAAPPAVTATDGSRQRPADMATVVAVFVCLLFLLPARLVMSRLPLSISSATLVALALGVFWMCAQMTTTLGAAKGSSPVRTMFLAYGFALLLSFWSMSVAYLPSDERSLGDHAMITAFALIFVGLAVCDGITTRERVYFLVRVIVACGCFVSFVGILQYLFLFDLTPYLKPPLMRFTAEDPLVLSRAGIPRVSGTAAHPIEFGVFCAMVLPLALHLTSLGTGSRAVRAARWTAVALLATGLMFSVSRSAIVALVCVVLVMAIGWTPERRVRMLSMAACFIGGIAVFMPSIVRTLFNLFAGAGNDGSVQWRTHDYATARRLISEHLLLGRGMGTWYPPKHEIFDNQYLATLVGSGVIGLAALLGIFVAAAWAAFCVVRLSHEEGGPSPCQARDRDLALALMASVMVVFPTFATFDFMAFAKVASLAVILAGLAGALLRIVARDTDGADADEISPAATAR